MMNVGKNDEARMTNDEGSSNDQMTKRANVSASPLGERIEVRAFKFQEN